MCVFNPGHGTYFILCTGRRTVDAPWSLECVDHSAVVNLCIVFLVVFLVEVVELMSGPTSSEPRVASADELLDTKAALDGAVERLER